jgi:hypothetical protein
MRISEYKAALPVLFAARVTALVWGRHGIGKSTAPDQFAAENGHKLFNLRLGNMEVGDLLGLPSTDGAETRFNMPDWLREVFEFATANPTKYAIIHLDEINRVRRDMLSPVFQIALDYRLHTYVFPDNVRVIASANPPTKDYQGVYDITDCAFLDRFCHIKLEPSVEEWLDYQRSIGSDDKMTRFYSQHPTTIEHVGEDFSVDSLVKPSRRSSEAAMRLYKLGAPQSLIYGCIGATVGQMFYAWVQKDEAKSIKGEQIRLEWSKVKKKVEELVKNGEMGQLKTICGEINGYYAPLKDIKAVTKKEINNLRDFFDTIPEDMAYGELLKLVRTSEALRDSDFGGDETYAKKWLAIVKAKPELTEQAKKMDEEAAKAADEKSA